MKMINNLITSVDVNKTKNNTVAPSLGMAVENNQSSSTSVVEKYTNPLADITNILNQELPTAPADPLDLYEFVKTAKNYVGCISSYIKKIEVKENPETFGTIYSQLQKREADIKAIILEAELKMANYINSNVSDINTKEDLYKRLGLSPNQGRKISALSQERIDYARETLDKNVVLTRTLVNNTWDAKEAAEKKAKADKIKQQQRLDAIARTKETPEDATYDFIYAYPFAPSLGMTIDEVKELSIPSDENATLYLWTPADRLVDALGIVSAWEFSYKNHLIWDRGIIKSKKEAQNTHDLLLIAIKGEGSHCDPNFAPKSICNDRLSDEEKANDECLHPDYYLDCIEKNYPENRYLEVFTSRGYSDKWTIFNHQKS